MAIVIDFNSRRQVVNREELDFYDEDTVAVAVAAERWRRKSEKQRYAAHFGCGWWSCLKEREYYGIA